MNDMCCLLEEGGADCHGEQKVYRHGAEDVAHKGELLTTGQERSVPGRQFLGKSLDRREQITSH